MIEPLLPPKQVQENLLRRFQDIGIPLQVGMNSESTRTVSDSEKAT